MKQIIFHSLLVVAAHIINAHSSSAMVEQPKSNGFHPHVAGRTSVIKDDLLEKALHSGPIHTHPRERVSMTNPISAIDSYLAEGDYEKAAPLLYGNLSTLSPAYLQEYANILLYRKAPRHLIERDLTAKDAAEKEAGDIFIHLAKNKDADSWSYLNSLDTNIIQKINEDNFPEASTLFLAAWHLENSGR